MYVAEALDPQVLEYRLASDDVRSGIDALAEGRHAHLCSIETAGEDSVLADRAFHAQLFHDACGERVITGTHRADREIPEHAFRLTELARTKVRFDSLPPAAAPFVNESEPEPRRAILRIKPQRVVHRLERGFVILTAGQSQGHGQLAVEIDSDIRILALRGGQAGDDP